MRLPNRIHELRVAKGLSLEQLAKLLGTTNQQVSHLELGKRQLTVNWLMRLGVALDCHPWAIVEAVPLISNDEAELLQDLRALSSTERERLLDQARRDSATSNTD